MSRSTSGSARQRSWPRTNGGKFDAKGNPTACGVAVLDEKNDELIIATATK